MIKLTLLLFHHTLFSAILMALMFSQAFAGPPAHYPVPDESENQLFYLQRSTSKHTIMYDANVLRRGQLNPKKPVNAYWLRYNKSNESKRRNLNFAERNFAYGLSFKQRENNIYEIELKAYSEREIYVFINKEGKAVAKTTINQQPAILKSIYIDVKGSGFWLTVNSIELVGTSLKDGSLLKEQFNPDD